MKRALCILLAFALAGCASIAATPTPTPSPTATPTATATATSTPSPTATITPTPPILTPTPPVFTEPQTLIPEDWWDVRIERLCLDVREYYTNVGGGFSLSLASQAGQVLSRMGMEVVEVGEPCDATLTFNWTLTAYSQRYTTAWSLGSNQTTLTCFTGAEIRGDVRLADEERIYSAPFHEIKYPPSAISSVLAGWVDPSGISGVSGEYATTCPEEASGAPFEELWPKAMLEQLLLLWGPPAIHAALDTGDPTLQLGALQAMHGASLQFDDHTDSILLLHAMQSEDVIVRRLAVDYLGDSVDDELANVGLLLALDDPDAWVRYYAAEGLAESEAPTGEMVTALIGALDDPVENVRTEAAEALAALTGEDFGTDADAWQAWWDGQTLP
jgi:hypothetical protein